MDEVVGKNLAARRFALELLGLFAAVAFLIAAIGIYGVMAYTFSRRIGEIGLRMTLGAQRSDILKIALGEGARMVVFGVAAGLIGSAILTRFLQTLLFEIKPIDPITFGVLTVLLASVALFVVGLRIFVCSNLSFAGDFNIVLAKHSKNFSLKHAVSIGIDEAQRGFEPMRMQVEHWKSAQITDNQAKLAIYRAFIEEELAVPKHLARAVHREYFQPSYDEFRPRTAYSLQNAFTSAFKEIESPISFYRATAQLGRFFQTVQ